MTDKVIPFPGIVGYESRDNSSTESPNHPDIDDKGWYRMEGVRGPVMPVRSPKSELRRTIMELIDRNSVMAAEIKSQEQILKHLLDEIDRPGGAA